MATLRRAVLHGWFLPAVGAAVLVGALIVLWSPVYLDAVDKCHAALAHRRAWVVPLAGVGAGIVTAELVAWARHTTASTANPSDQVWAERPDTALHEAARLDRRLRAHGPPPGNTAP